MLQKLYIQNYAIIDELVISFSKGMNVITGETGAGKSILMGALSLILGDRADTAVLLKRDKKCVVEGVFVPGNKKAAADFFKEQDLDTGDEVVVRREITPNGKSRAFINDTPVNLEQLRVLCSLLVDLHRQFDTLALGESDFPRQVLDALAGQAELLDSYRREYRDWQAGTRELAALRERKAQFHKEMDYYTFLYDELNELGLREQELEDLDRELKVLSNSESIKTSLAKIYYELEEGEQPLVQHLRSLQHILEGQTFFHPDLPALSGRMHSLQVELQDIARELDQVRERVNHDPVRIEEINQRLSAGYKLLKKHGVRTTTELLAVRQELENKLKASLHLDEEIDRCEKEVTTLLTRARQLAGRLSKNRQAQVLSLEKDVNNLLKQVGMPNARIQVRIEAGELQANGMDNIEFMFDANKSNRYAPVRKVASGGELSRLMLCIKSLVAESIDLATLIFDEIDTGISGEAARQAGIILNDLSKRRQVISITHQPQIAGKADAHYFVYKELCGEEVRTNIRLLTKEERITAIAKMLGGEKPTAAAMENAREMVN
jgi:DNA repair protein RecN (Recombination protein N)